MRCSDDVDLDQKSGIYPSSMKHWSINDAASVEVAREKLTLVSYT